MPQLGVVGGSSQQRSLAFNAERTVNLFPIVDQRGKEPSSLLGTPGLNLFSNLGTGPGRGEFAASNGRSFVVSGSSLYELLADGTSVLRGALDQSQGIVTMDENGFQLAVCDGQSLYILTYATNAFTKVTDPDLPSAQSVTYISGYFVVNQVNSGIFRISGLFNGLTWGALDFATAESSPDNLVRVLNVVGQLWLFGTKTTEVWYNSGDVTFPFARVAGGKLETGISGPYTAIALDNSAYWVGQDNRGFGIVYKASGFTAQRISTEPMEIRIQSAPTPATLRSFSYQEDGHTFYVLTGGGMETTLVYDLSTQLWHERAYLNEDGDYELHLAADSMFAFNQTLVCDRNNGNVYTMSLDYYSDNGDEMASDRIFTHIFNDNKRFTVNNVTINFETGVGLQNGQGSDPKAVLRYSRDGGLTWSGDLSRSIGKVGNYLARAVWHRLGQFRQATFRVRVTDPVKRAITGGEFNSL